MKFYKRFLSLFVVFVLLCVTFSTTVSAADTEKYIDGQQQSLYFHKKDNSEVYLAPTLYSWEGNLEKGISFKDNLSNFSYSNYPYFRITYTLRNKDYSVLFKKGDKVTVYYDSGLIYLQDSSGNKHYPTGALPKQATYTLKYTDGTFSNTYPIDSDNVIYNPSTQLMEVKADIMQAPKDVCYVQFKVYFDYSTFGGSGTNYFVNFGYPNGKVNTRYTIEDETKGLLGGIIEWIKSIFNKIGDIFDSISSGFANIGTWFAELPGKLWAVISDGLKSLFVPDEQYMTGYKDKWDSLLSSRFGAIYDVGTIITDFVSQIQMSDKTNTIKLPSVNLNSVGIPFSFGGYDVQIVPNGFTTLVEICKKIISIVCTFLFINGLRKRYDEVMGVNQ